MRDAHSNVYSDSFHKACTGLVSTLRGTIPKNKPASGWLASDDRPSNQEISSNWVLIGSYFGRFCQFISFGSKWHWSEDKYDEFIRFGVALTNTHVIWNPLREMEGKLY